MSQRANKRVDRDMGSLRETVLQMARLSEAILDKSLQAIWERDSALALEVKDDDLAIDRLDVEIDDTVLRILALDAPVASDLRLVVAVKSVATDLERVGDIARNIASCARRLSDVPPIELPPQLHSLADDSRAALRNAVQALADLDADAARRVLEDDDKIDDKEDELIRASIDRLEDDPDESRQQIDMIFIAQHLERIGDHATNIAEEVVLATEATNLKHSDKLGER
ncbi:MAG: phosphate signaling complex protein PhoU [bacterium]|nr:phosphate signaling complex protein PhoU [bacterium]